MPFEFAQNILSALPIAILPLMLVVPLVGALIAYLAGSKGARIVTLVIAVIEMGLALLLALAIDPSLGLTTSGGVYGWQFTMGQIEAAGTTTTFQILLGVDGISVVMVVLANLVMLVAAISSNHIKDSEGLYYAFFLLLQVGLLGVFMSVDLIGFFIFWEIVLIPMFFIIGRWGEEGSQHAAVKFFIYTHLGSAAMLVGFFALYFFFSIAASTA